MLSGENFKKAMKLTSPVLFRSAAAGIPFALMAAGAGFPWWLAPLMSLVIYSETAQYIGIALFASGIVDEANFWSSLLGFLGIEFFVSLEQFFYSLSFIKKYSETGKWKIPLIFTLSGETCALIAKTEVPKDAKKGSFYAAVSILDFSYWFLGTLAGSIAGELIPAGYLDGVDFALAALFIVVMIDQIRASKDWIPTVVGILTCALAVALSYIQVNGRALLPSKNIILVGLSLGIAVIIFVKGIFGKREIRSEEQGASR